KML
ncbi:Tetraacyldisaccharide 4'-kinase, partial [Haemophilus influenzae]